MTVNSLENTGERASLMLHFMPTESELTNNICNLHLKKYLGDIIDTHQPLYSIVCYNMVLDIPSISAGPLMVMTDFPIQLYIAWFG